MNTATTPTPEPSPEPPDRFGATNAALPDAIRTFLAPPRYATLASIDPDGTPHQAVVWYALEGDTILVNSRRGRRWPANLERNANVHLAVYDDAEPTHWVGLKGRVHMLHDGAPALSDIKALSRRYGEGDPDRFDGQERVSFTIEIDRSFEYGSR